MSKKPQLHEVLAVEGELGSTAKRVLEDAVNTFQKKPNLFKGQTRTLSMLDDARSGENTTSDDPVAETVPERLKAVDKVVGRHYDAVYQKEHGNTIAKADLVVDGNVLIKDAPATFLLAMESRLLSLRNTYAAAPTLDPGTRWTEDVNAGAGIFMSEDKVGFKTEKSVNSKVLYEATKEHPAQIEKWSEDISVGKITTVQRSGMISTAHKAKLLERIDTLIRACKRARMRANAVELEPVNVASALFDYIHGA